MIVRQDKHSWQIGRAAGAKGLPPTCPKGLDPLAFASGYIEGKAERTKHCKSRQPCRSRPIFGSG
jgi:hypothetical protein